MEVLPQTPLDFERARTFTVLPMASDLTIKAVATRCGLSLHTLLYYEHIGRGLAHYRQIEHSRAPDQPIEGA